MPSNYGEPAPVKPNKRQQSALIRRLVGGGTWVLAGRIAGILLLLVCFVVLARWLPPAEFGLFLVIISVINFLSTLGRFGLDRVLIRFLSEGLGTENGTLVQRTLRDSFAMGLASALCVSVAGGLVLKFAVLSQLPAVVFLLLGAAVLLVTMLHLVAEALRGFHQLHYASLFSPQSGPLTTLLFFVALIAMGATPPSLSIALMCYTLPAACILPLALFILARTANRSLSKLPRESRGTRLSISLSQLIALSSPIAISDTLTFLSMNAGLWIVAVCCSEHDLALFGAARQLAMLVVLPLNLVNVTVMSTIPELYAQRQLAKLQRVLQISASVATIPTLLLVLMFVIAPAPILDLVFGSFYREAAILLVILSLPRLVVSWTGSCFNVLLLTGHQKLVAVLNVLLVITLIGLGAIFGIWYGATGVAVVSAVVIAIINLLVWLIAKFQVGVWTHATLRIAR